MGGRGNIMLKSLPASCTIRIMQNKRTRFYNPLARQHHWRETGVAVILSSLVLYACYKALPYMNFAASSQVLTNAFPQEDILVQIPPEEQIPEKIEIKESTKPLLLEEDMKTALDEARDEIADLADLPDSIKAGDPIQNDQALTRELDAALSASAKSMNSEIAHFELPEMAVPQITVNPAAPDSFNPALDNSLAERLQKSNQAALEQGVNNMLGEAHKAGLGELDKLAKMPLGELGRLGGSASLGGDVLFKFNSFELSNDFRIFALKLAGIVDRNNQVRLVIVGHTDGIGDSEYNKKLSLLRAKAIVDYLVSKRINIDNVWILGAGSSQNKVPIDLDREAQAPNRRVDLLFLTNEQQVPADAKPASWKPDFTLQNNRVIPRNNN